MRYNELVKKLGRLGCEFVRQAGRSHEIWRNPKTNGVTVIPHHTREIWCNPNEVIVIPHHTREISPKALSKILRQLGLKPEDLHGQ